MKDYRKVIHRMDHSAIQKHLRCLASLDKPSGSRGASDAAHYILDQLKACGVPCQMEVFDAYVSNPLEGSLTISGHSCSGFSSSDLSCPDFSRSGHCRDEEAEIRCRPRSFSADCAEGVEGELVFDPADAADALTDRKREERFSSFRGKIVVSRGYDERYGIMLGRYGAKGWVQVWTSQEELIHEDIAGGVWGTPSADTSMLLPTIPIVGITAGSGRRLERLIGQGAVQGRLSVRMDTGVKTLQMPAAAIPGRTDEFVLLSCHYDTWYKGAVDNCAANAAAIEMARLFWEYRDELERGIRIVWWAGHSNGRYAGSAWYCDNHWAELRQRCVAHITADLTGSRHGKQIGFHTTGAEGRSYMREEAEAVEPGVDIQYLPIGRGADQSFWGLEIPIHFYSRYIAAEGEKQTDTPGPGVRWWHTAEDTIDKVDEEVLRKDAELFYLHGYRLAAERLLPFCAEEYFAEADRILREADLDSEEEFSFSEIRQQLDTLGKITAAAWEAAAETERKNELVKKICGGVNRLRQSGGSPYGQDLAITAACLFPGLCAVKGKRKNNMDPATYLFMKTDFIRQKNRMICELRRMIAEVTALASGGSEAK